jgi:hypothetical protein
MFCMGTANEGYPSSGGFDSDVVPKGIPAFAGMTRFGMNARQNVIETPFI